jgi:hypothetical protein
MEKAITERNITGRPSEKIEVTTILVSTGLTGAILGFLERLDATSAKVFVALFNAVEIGVFEISDATSAKVFVALFNAIVALPNRAMFSSSGV